MGPSVEEIEELAKTMTEQINDSATIATSALSLAANRSIELDMNPITTMFVLKYLVQANIDAMELQTFEEMPSGKYTRAEHLVHMNDLEQMVVRFVQKKTKKVVIKGGS